MIDIEKEITQRPNLANNESLTKFRDHAAQQSDKAYSLFYEFLNKEQPARILEIGAGMGGFTSFLRIVLDDSGATNVPLRSYDIHEHPWFNGIRSRNIDLRVENIFSEGLTVCKQEVIDFIQQEGKTIVLCDGGCKIKEFALLSKYIKPGDFILAHDYAHDREIFDKDINKKIWNWCEITEADVQEPSVLNNLVDYNKQEFNNAAWLCKIKR